jgi:hypothetical protein
LTVGYCASRIYAGISCPTACDNVNAIIVTQSGVPTGGFIFFGQNTNQGPAQYQAYQPIDGLLTPSSNELALGRVSHGDAKKITFELTNHTRKAVEVAHLWTSCPCLTVQLASNTIQPSETVAGDLILELEHGMEFKGYLQIEIEGRCPTGELAFALTAPVTIVEAK